MIVFKMLTCGDGHRARDAEKLLQDFSTLSRE
jgi:hypothetical protein